MRDTISEGYKTALKAGDKRRTATLRAISAAIKDKDIAGARAGQGAARRCRKSWCCSRRW